jgi:hypothetical protein
MHHYTGPELATGSPRHPSLALEHDWYFPYIPVPDSTVENYVTDIQKPNEHTRGIVYTDGVTMTDDHTYAVVRGVPNEPICDFSLVMTTAWLTSPRGHNRHTVEHFMRLGIPIVAIGAEGSYRDGQSVLSKSMSKRLANISIRTSAHNFHEILNSVDDLVDGQTVDTKQAVILGESRGGMVGEAVIAFAWHQGRSIIYSDLTAPCFPEGLDIKDAPDMALQAAREPIELIKSVGSITIGRLIHYPETLDLHPSAILHNIATIPALLSPDTGKLAKQIPRTHNQHITAFKDDFICDVDGWRKILKNHPNVRIVPVEGAHTTIAHPTTLSYIESRVMQLVAETKSAGTLDPKLLDFSRVHLSDGTKPL